MRLPRTSLHAFALSTATVLLAVLAACSDATNDTATDVPAADPREEGKPLGPLPDDRTADGGNKGSAPDAGGPDAAPVPPKTFDVTGTARVSCLFRGQLPPAHTVCTIEPVAVQLQPAMSGTLQDHVIIQASTAKELQFTEGLALKSPAPSACLTHLVLKSTGFDLTVSSLTAEKTPCDAPEGGVKVTDFGTTFELETPALYYPVNKQSFGYDVTLKVKLTLVP